MNQDKSLPIIEAALDLYPPYGSLFVAGLTAWSFTEVFAGWTEVDRQPPRNESTLESTTIVYRNSVTDQMLAISMTLAASQAAAGKALAGYLENNQLDSLPTASVGQVGFMTQPNVPPAVYFVRSNAAIVVASAGGSPVDVLPFALKMDAVIYAYPQSSKPGLWVQAATTSQSGVYLINIFPPAPSNGSYFQLWAGAGAFTYDSGLFYISLPKRATPVTEVEVFEVSFDKSQMTVTGKSVVPPSHGRNAAAGG